MCVILGVLEESVGVNDPPRVNDRRHFGSVRIREATLVPADEISDEGFAWAADI